MKASSDVLGAEQASLACPIKVGLIVDSEFVPKYVYDIAVWGQEQNNIKISHLVIQDSVFISHALRRYLQNIKRYGLIVLIREAAFTALAKLEGLLSVRYLKNHDHRRTFDATNIVANCIKVSPRPGTDCIEYYYSDEDVEKIRDLELDLIVSCSSGVLRGDVLSAASLGVIACDQPNNAVSAGFAEVYKKQEDTGFAIYSLTAAETANVLLRGRLPTSAYFGVNKAILLKKSYFFLKKVINETAKMGKLPPVINSLPHPVSPRETPALIEQFKYIQGVSAGAARKIVNRFLLKKKYRWNVAFQRKHWGSLIMGRAHKIENPPHGYLADPFIVRENQDYCFVEDYDYKANKGCIAVYKLNESSAERLGRAIVEPFHMSFPFPFRFEGKLYICPETQENRDIRLYECVEFPLKWKLSRIIMSNVSAADTMIFEHDGLWWLFTSINSAEGADHNSELHIFYAGNPLSSAWTPHRRNPIYIDPSKARNGGLLIDRHGLFRVAQKQGFSVYGEGFSINKIALLNTNEYIEERLCSIEPNFFPNIIGTHHLHGNGDLCAFDYLEFTALSRKCPPGRRRYAHRPAEVC